MPSETENIIITWYRNNELVNYFRRNEFQIYQNGSLRLPPNEKSNGIYRCLVNGTKLDLGAIFSNLTTVEYPVLKRRNDAPTNFTVAIGETFKFDCPIISIPSASISWFFSNTSTSSFLPINDENSYIILKNGSLIIKSVEESNKGRYKCTARNKYALKTHRQSILNLTIITTKFSSKSTTTTTKTTTTNLEKNSNKNSEKLIRILQENTYYVRSGDNLILYCDTYKQDIKIAWTFLPTWSNKTYEIANHTKTIEIVNASVDNYEGIYNCSTRSDFQIFNVIVTIPPVIDNPLVSYEKQIANKVSLNCTATGKPEPEIIWYRNGIKLENNYTIHINSSNLKINSFDDKDVGVYQCFARNIAGETSSTSYLELKQKDIEMLPDRPRNVKCYPINYRLMNVTFESNHHIETININMARKNPPEWFAQFPLDTTQKQFLLIQDRIIFEPFMLYLRTIVLTGYKKFNSGKEEKHVEPSLMSEGVSCATQGLEIHPVFFPNGIYIWWYYENSKNKQNIIIEYFVIQFLNDGKNSKEESTKFGKEIIGTTRPLKSIERKNIEQMLEKIPVLTKLPNSENFYLNEADDTEITNLIVAGNITGILIPNTTKLIVRIIAITEANKNFKQDFRYMEWKNIKRQEKQFAVPMIQAINSRSINFQWDEQLIANISCVRVCYQSTNLNERWINGKGACQNIQTKNPIFTIEKLKPKWSLEFTFSDCETRHTYGSISEIVTLADPPGPISNFRIFKNDGYKLTWDQPTNPNGKIVAYLIEWTVNNSTTYQANVTANEKYFQLPNITENINISVRAYSENSLGLPIYVDLSKNIESIETEKNDYFDPVIGIAIGLFLSIICVIFFIFLYINQKKNFKTRLASPSSTTIAPFPPISTGNISITGINGSEIGTRHNRISPTKSLNINPTLINRNLNAGIEANKLSSEQDCNEYHEMQTLIPHQSNLNVISSNDRTTILTPLSDIFPVPHNGDAIAYYYRNGNRNDDELENDACPVALCSSTPLPQRSKSSNFNTNKFLERNKTPSIIPISFKNKNKQKIKLKNHKINKTSSSPDFNTSETYFERKSLDKNYVDMDINVTQPINKPIAISKQNGSIKNTLPSSIPKNKHSKTSSDVALCNYKDSKHPCNKNSDVEKIHSIVDSNYNTTPMENNSQYNKLIEDNNSSCDKNFSQNSTNNDSSNISNCTATTILNSEDISNDGGGGDNNGVKETKKDILGIVNSDTCSSKVSIYLKEDGNGISKAGFNKTNLSVKEIENNLIRVNRNYRRPIIDPNG
ncbi:uncharacterized protein LOC129611775 [Condylostylus longicornis]|uniref:uncharacterized protein LOC129611775 n=1 Tax=Condylostylus longicornis TaxID=2530218 RepID=UPI00244DCB2D|nr:uncharacterized protein LOC129611775 [Condylostylus longicornis]